MSENDKLFEEAKRGFDWQTRESMDRTRLSAEDVRKMLPPHKVLAGLALMGLTYKAVDVYVT